MPNTLAEQLHIPLIISAAAHHIEATGLETMILLQRLPQGWESNLQLTIGSQSFLLLTIF